MATMPLGTILRDYSDGDEHGWHAEFAYLATNHQERVTALREDVARNGIREPITLGPDGRVWDGHHRLYVALSLGLTDVPVQQAKES